MATSFRERFKRYVSWRIRKMRQSPRLINFILVLVLCFGLLLVAELYQKPQSEYDKTGFSHYPITLSCQMVRVIDGDTVVLKCPKENDEKVQTLRSIRIWGMDAPETQQKPWGNFATQTLKDIIAGRSLVTLQVLAQDRYQRSIGKIYIAGEDLGLEMVRRGAAVVYRRYNDDENYITVEKKAKIANLGIWAVSGAQQNPEGWRRFNP